MKYKATSYENDGHNDPDTTVIVGDFEAVKILWKWFYRHQGLDRGEIFDITYEDNDSENLDSNVPPTSFSGESSDSDEVRFNYKKIDDNTVVCPDCGAEINLDEQEKIFADKKKQFKDILKNWDKTIDNE